jgi:hypothetical protein
MKLKTVCSAMNKFMPFICICMLFVASPIGVFLFWHLALGSIVPAERDQSRESQSN